MNDPHPSRRPGLLASGGPVRPALLILLTYAVLGAVAGVVWQWVWTPPGQVIDHHQVLYDSYASLRRVFTGTGLYALVAAVTSALVALAVTLLTRGRELLVLALVVVGSALAAALMWRVGTLLGPADPAAVAAHTAGRASVPGQLQVSGKSPYLAWPMTSLFVLALVYFALPGSFAHHRGDDTGASDRPEADVPGPRHG
ncbi:MAG TPA: hypothetical protein VGK78_19185 [Nocardioides sp.]